MTKTQLQTSSKLYNCLIIFAINSQISQTAYIYIKLTSPNCVRTSQNTQKLHSQLYDAEAVSWEVKTRDSIKYHISLNNSATTTSMTLSKKYTKSTKTLLVTSKITLTPNSTKKGKTWSKTQWTSPMSNKKPPFSPKNPAKSSSGFGKISEIFKNIINWVTIRPWNRKSQNSSNALLTWKTKKKSKYKNTVAIWNKKKKWKEPSESYRNVWSSPPQTTKSTSKYPMTTSNK